MSDYSGSISAGVGDAANMGKNPMYAGLLREAMRQQMAGKKNTSVLDPLFTTEFVWSLSLAQSRHNFVTQDAANASPELDEVA